jgi:hypothetical protein
MLGWSSNGIGLRSYLRNELTGRAPGRVCLNFGDEVVVDWTGDFDRPEQHVDREHDHGVSTTKLSNRNVIVVETAITSLE